MIFKNLLLLLLLAGWCTGYAQTTRVNIVSTIHSAHKINPNYTYEDLFEFIEEYDPDVIGVEIRQTDLDSSETYLTAFYPYEMREVLKKYSSKKRYGFDWLGTSIEGKPIPEDYFKDLYVKKLQQALQKDSLMTSKLAELAPLTEEKNQLARQASLTELNDGRYDTANTLYYEKMAALLKGTPYQPLSDFYRQRDEQIADRLVEIIRENPGRKILFLLGADHRSYALKRVQEVVGNTVILNDALKK